MALGKWICQLRPIGTLYTFTARGLKGRDISISFGGLDNFRGTVSLPPEQLTFTASNFFEIMSLFDKNKISFNDVVRLKGLIKAQVERGK
ncbi:MAG: hypothetical protein AUJ49_01095 [Desulfovibrionaceae bacterium CG1_02_65_16]|nr:MAG: hypothetical protein AUJ49_01095 [Desulfovibrionaceae bacterium CG1_02_65_16]